MSAAFFVSPAGQVARDIDAARDRLGAEARAMASVLAAAVPPERCGDAIPVAPARGPQVAFTLREMVRTEAGNWRAQRAGWQGRDSCRVADAFDRMDVAARKAQARHDPDAGFVAPFTAGQVAAARDYAALTERVAASGVKCASLESLGRTGGGGLAVTEAVARDILRLRALHRRIGEGVAKDVVRPSRGGMRSAIRVRALVDQVCLGGMTLAEVAAAHGWAKNASIYDCLAAALRAALDRMQGYDLVRPQHLG